MTVLLLIAMASGTVRTAHGTIFRQKRNTPWQLLHRQGIQNLNSRITHEIHSDQGRVP
jgi:hypothetical protein